MARHTIPVLCFALALGRVMWPTASGAEGAVALGVPANVAKSGVTMGYATSYPTREEAEREAMTRCRAGTSAVARSLCRVVKNFTDQCVALAIDPVNGTAGYGMAVAATEEAARNAALEMCIRNSSPSRRKFCKIDKSSCDRVAKVEDEWKLCRGNDDKSGIPACNRLIANSRLSAREHAEASVEMGLFSAGKDPNGALSAYDRAIGFDPAYARAYLERSRTYEKLKDNDRAIADASKAIELEPRTEYYYQRRGYLFGVKKELDRALADYDKSIAIKPAVWAHIERADILIEKGATDRALGDYKKAADLVDTESTDAQKPLADIIKRLMKQSRIDDAAYVVSKITDDDLMMELRLLREYEPLWSNASATAALAEEPRAARNVATFEKASAREPRSLYYKTKLVGALKAAGRYADAERVGYETLATLSAHDEVDKREFFLRGEIAAALVADGKTDKAKAIMEPVLAEMKAGRLDRDPVSPTLNYSEDLLAAGKHLESFEAASLAVGKTSSYGASVTRSTQVCSAFALGRKAEAASILASMLKDMNESDKTVKLTAEALVCVGENDKAADIMIKTVNQFAGKITWFASCRHGPNRLNSVTDSATDMQHVLELPKVEDAVKAVARTRPGC